MEFSLSEGEGALLVALARQAIRLRLERGERLNPPSPLPERLQQKCGVFVTLNEVKESGEKALRGCIGYPEPTLPLVEATIDAAVHAATADPRFNPVALEELLRLIVEVSVLTPLQLITTTSPNQLPAGIKVGEDGLVIERGWNKGLLLPQVAVEWGWDAEEFLAHCCMKAGLPPDAWLMNGTRVYKFQAIIFEEEKPNGPVRRAGLKPTGNCA